MAYIGVLVGQQNPTAHLTGTMDTHQKEYILPPTYDGAYEATPTSSVQMFATASKMMESDFKVNKTPYSEVSNIHGGYTATIL